MALHPGDEILVLDQAYGAVVKAAEFVARAAGATVVTVGTPFPVQGDVTTACADAVERALTPRTRLAVLDHISSETALTLPVAAMTARCRARGVPVLIDGAHAPGAIALDIESLGADWFVGNLHKWAFAPRACAFVWVAPARRAALHPPVISWGLDAGLAQEFDWTGTRDPSAVLSAPAGLAFMRDVLGLEAMRAWNHDLVWRMAHVLAARWGQPWRTPEAMVGCMASVPLPARIDALGEAAVPALKDWLLYERAIEAQVLAIRGHAYVRLAAQVYNDEADFERLARAVDDWPGA
jgi:isopenicillin-N epimerase